LRKDCLEIDARIERRIASRDMLTAERQAMLNAAQAVANALATASSQPDAFAAVPDLPALGKRAADASATLIRKLALGHGKLDEPVRQRIEMALEARRFFDAIDAVPIPPPSAQMSALQADTGRPLVPPATLLRPLVAGMTPLKVDAAAVPPVVDLAVLELWQARTARQLVCAKALQTAVVAIVMLGASYAFYEDRFLGTPTELLGLFFWGFTSDVSMAGLLALAGGLAAKLKN
jgi:hypothetical protein